MDTFRLLLMRKVDLILSAYTHHGLRFSVSGWYFVYATLPFGWKADAYIYYSIGLAATSFIRLHGVPCSHYIDDNYIDTSVRGASSQARVNYIFKALVYLIWPPSLLVRCFYLWVV